MKIGLLTLVLFLFSLNAQAAVYNCYQNNFDQNGSMMNATVRTGGNVISVSLSTLTPGSMYSAQFHILGEAKSKLEYKATDVETLYSEGPFLDSKGFINKIKSTYDMTLTFAKEGRLNSLAVNQDLGGWTSEWTMICAAIPNTEY